MKYLVCKKQVGEGCDYTIGCGYRFDWMEVADIQAAIEKTVWPDGRGDESCAIEGENALVTILVIPAESVTIVDVAAIRMEVARLRKKEADEAQRTRELAELERLRRKYST